MFGSKVTFMIREATMTDAKALCDLNNNEMGYDVSLDFTKEQLTLILMDKSHHVLAVFEDDVSSQVIGYIHAEIYRELYAEDVLNVLGIAVKESQQRKGIGKLLIQWLEEEAVRRDIHMIRLNSGASRVSAHHFYQTLGFEEIKIQKKFVKKL